MYWCHCVLIAFILLSRHKHNAFPSQSPGSAHHLAPPPEVLGQEVGSDGAGVGVHDIPFPVGHTSPSVCSLDDPNPTPPQPARSSSPPVPALMRKLTGWWLFSIFMSHCIKVAALFIVNHHQNSYSLPYSILLWRRFWMNFQFVIFLRLGYAVLLWGKLYLNLST